MSEQDNNTPFDTQDNTGVENTGTTEGAATEGTDTQASQEHNESDFDFGNTPAELVPAGKLTQTDDAPRENTHKAISPAAIREISRTKGNWQDSFDPQVGMIGHPSEANTYVVPVKITQLVPDMEGPAKNKTQKVINGVAQYKPMSVLKDMPVAHDKEYVQKSLGDVAKDTVSKYVLEHLLKEHFNKLHDSEYYGRKVPVFPLNSAFPTSLQAIEAISGVSYQQFLEETFRKGWYKASAKMQQFEYNVFCQSKEDTLAILAQKGDIMSKWKSTDFPTLAVATATFKRIGTIVEQGFEYKGRKPLSSLLFSVLDAIKVYEKQYVDTANKIEEMQQNIEEGRVPGHTELPEKLAHTLEACNTQIEHWVAVVCGIKNHAEQLRDQEETKLAKVNAKILQDAASDDTFDGLMVLPELDFPEFSADGAL